jgi:DNA-binding transcriptional regulator YdaS (Cro superfamily)
MADIGMSEIKSERDPGLVAALEAAGGGAPLARLLGLNHSAVSRWRKVPAHRIIQIEAETGVPREVLRPDLYEPKEGV